MKRMRGTALGLWAIWAGLPGSAGQVSLFDEAVFAVRPAALLPGSDAGAQAAPVRHASLFAGTEATGLFAPLPERRAAPRRAASLLAPQTAALLALIARAEAGPDGYDAVQHRAVRRPARKPTEMSLSAILAWIDETPGQSHAIGRYQFIPATLRRLIARAGVGGAARFSPELQDRLALILLSEAGLEAFRNGDMSREAFMANLAKIWAGLPTAEGVSHYEGIAGNKATMSWARFDAEMAMIFDGNR